MSVYTCCVCVVAIGQWSIDIGLGEQDFSKQVHSLLGIPGEYHDWF